MSLARVFVTDFLPTEPDWEREELDGLATVDCCAAESEADLAPILAEAEALIVWHVIQVGAATISQLDRCRVIVRAGVGFDNVDGAAAAAKGIPLCNVPDYGTEDVADHAVAMGLSLLRRMTEAAAQVRSGGWDWRLIRPVERIRGRVAGIVGLGRIGTATALRLKAFGLDVQFYDPYRVDGADKSLGVRRCETLDELLATSDLISLHVPLDDGTRNLIDAAALAQMKDQAILVNTARGGVVDTAAVAAALDAGRLRGVGLDVLPSEPGTDADPLYAGWRAGKPWADKVILTPHCAFCSEEGMEELRRKGARTVARMLRGEPLRNIVNGVAEQV